MLWMLGCGACSGNRPDFVTLCERVAPCENQSVSVCMSHRQELYGEQRARGCGAEGAALVACTILHGACQPGGATWNPIFMLADIVKRVTRQADRFFAKRADADGKAVPADPVMANLLQYALFGPQELERVAPTTANGKTGQPKLKSRNCVDFDGFNLHANVRIHEVARERLEHLVRYVCRPVIAAKRLEPVGEHKIRITFKKRVERRHHRGNAVTAGSGLSNNWANSATSARDDKVPRHFRAGREGS
ncbi:MAG: hypothetical protein EXR77_16565 [Myxococcales bacterium]|nr:hypothetical protein [Myxococcales bacterium]